MKPSHSKAGQPRHRNMVGKEILALRLTQPGRMSQKKLAWLLEDYHGVKMNRSAIAKIEAGTRCVLDYELAAIAAALRVSVEKLFPRSSPRGFEDIGYEPSVTGR